MFGTFFDGRTPQDLLAGGLYRALALALYSGPFWPVSVALIAGALGAVERGGSGAFRTAKAERSPLASDGASDKASESRTGRPLAREEHDYNAPENQPRGADHGNDASVPPRRMTMGALEAAAAARIERESERLAC